MQLLLHPFVWFVATLAGAAVPAIVMRSAVSHAGPWPKVLFVAVVFERHPEGVQR
ncbi:MAG TPA: hypothetical protein VFV19_10655 [Candidatus Polarisedimenticolaceae bacterium]|nr:hypothetical protein [Candidatus Polarisedimenticolaceae bacterium]